MGENDANCARKNQHKLPAGRRALGGARGAAHPGKAAVGESIGGRHGSADISSCDAGADDNVIRAAVLRFGSANSDIGGASLQRGGAGLVGHQPFRVR